MRPPHRSRIRLACSPQAWSRGIARRMRAPHVSSLRSPHGPASGRNAERLVVALLVIVVAISTGIGVGALTNVSLSTWGYGVGMVAFWTFGPALIVRYARRHEGLSPLPAVTGFFLLEFAAGAVFYRTPRVDSVLGGFLFAYTPGSLGIALVIAFGAWALLVVGYNVSRFTDEPLSHLPRPHVNDILTGVVVVLIVVGYAARVVMLRNNWYFHITDEVAAASGARNIVMVLSGLPVVAVAMIGARYYRERPHAAFIFWPLVLIEAVWATGSGGRAPLLSLGIMLIVVRAYASQKRFPIARAVVFALIAVLVVFPLVAAYRTVDASSNSYNADPIGRMGLVATQMVSQYSQSPGAAVLTGVDETLRRFAGIASLAAIVHRGTSFYPVQPGEALGTYAGALVPRAVLPTKRDASTIGNKFGLRYGVIQPGNTASVTITTIGDLWGTFGWGGLVVGMLILGGVMRALNFYLRERRENYAVLGVYAAMLGSVLLNFETTIASGLLQTLRAFVIYVGAVALTGGAIRLMRGFHGGWRRQEVVP